MVVKSWGHPWNCSPGPTHSPPAALSLQVGSSLGASLGHRGLLPPKVMLFPGDSWRPVVLSQPRRILGGLPNPEMPQEQQGLSGKDCVGWLPSHDDALLTSLQGYLPRAPSPACSSVLGSIFREYSPRQWLSAPQPPFSDHCPSSVTGRGAIASLL